MAPPPPSAASLWSSLAQILTVLDKTAPDLALQLRAVIAPGSPAALAGTLLFLLGALYRGAWPDADVDSALGTVGDKRLAQRLRTELADLARLRDDSATGAWRVSVLPLLAGTRFSRCVFISAGRDAAAPNRQARTARASSSKPS